MSISLLPLCWALGVGIDRQVSPHSPLRTASLFAAVLWALWIQAPLAFRSTCFGSSPLRGTSTIKVVDVRFRFYLSRRPWELWVSPNCGSLCWGWGLGWGCVPFSPLCLDVGFSLGVQCVAVSQIVSGFLSQGIVPLIAVNSVSLWGKVSPGASTILNH